MSKIEKRELWKERVSAYQSSGQSQSRWCADHDVNLHQLKYWIKKFRSEQLTRPDSSKWVSVQVTDQNEPSHLPVPSAMVVKVGKATIEVKPGFDPSLLAQVVKVLSENV